MNEQVDVVYTWVNGSDESLQEAVEYWRPRFLAENDNFKDFITT